jgi:hypothetical protein
MVEEFGLCDNLMIEGAIVEVVRAARLPKDPLASLEAFERCVVRAAAELRLR